MNTLWKKDGVDIDKEIMSFTIGDDQVLDNLLIRYDIIGSLDDDEEPEAETFESFDDVITEVERDMEIEDGSQPA